MLQRNASVSVCFLFLLPSSHNLSFKKKNASKVVKELELFKKELFPSTNALCFYWGCPGLCAEARVLRDPMGCRDPQGPRRSILATQRNCSWKRPASTEPRCSPCSWLLSPHWVLEAGRQGCQGLLYGHRGMAVMPDGRFHLLLLTQTDLKRAGGKIRIVSAIQQYLCSHVLISSHLHGRHRSLL